MRTPALSLLLTLLAAGAIAAEEAGDSLDFYSPQNLVRFADSLEMEGDYIRAAEELERALALLGAEPEVVPALYRRIAEAYRHGGDLERALKSYERWRGLAASAEDRAASAARIAYTYYLMERYQQSLEVLAAEGCTPATPQAGGEEPALVLCLDLLTLGRWDEAASVAAAGESESARTLRALALRGAEGSRKSAVAAALMSTVVPGLGKFYAGTAGDGLFSLLSIGTLVTLSVLSFHAEGVRSAEGWIAASLAAVLHAGNIWGSAQAARRYNDRLDQTILHDVAAVAAGLF
jgi:TM2 domain-containing membrane protein YozV